MMIIACCIPMLAIAFVLVATGVASAGLLVGALVCTAIMAAMMGATANGKRRCHDLVPRTGT